MYVCTCVCLHVYVSVWECVCVCVCVLTGSPEWGIFGVPLVTLLEQDQGRAPGTRVPIILQRVRGPQQLPCRLCLLFILPLCV